MKAVLYSINRPHTDNIKLGLKLWEIRKSKPNIPVPFPAFIYETKRNGGCGKVVGEFICDRIKPAYEWTEEDFKATCVSKEEYIEYAGKSRSEQIYGLHISNLKIYDKPKELIEFYKPCPNIDEDYRCYYCDCLADSDYGGYCTNYLTRPPQSWCYVGV